MRHSHKRTQLSDRCFLNRFKSHRNSSVLLSGHFSECLAPSFCSTYKYGDQLGSCNYLWTAKRWIGHITFSTFSNTWASQVRIFSNEPSCQSRSCGSLGGEDPLEGEMVAHSSILAREIPWTEEPGGLQSMGSQTVRHDWICNLWHSVDTLLTST